MNNDLFINCRYNKRTLNRKGFKDMEVAAVAVQQAMLQSNLGLAMVKKNADMQQAMVNMIAETVNATGRGQMVNIRA